MPIRVDQVVKRHGATLALDEVSLEIGSGLTAIIGPNGAGKSTLLAAIGRLLPVDAGRIEVDGLDVARAKSKTLARRLAILRQDNHLPIRLSVEELVAFGRYPHGGGGRSPEDRARIEESIALLGLVPQRERFLDELSGGQRQRAFVAMALAQDTDHLLLDEPLNNLDPRHAISLMKLLRQLTRDRRLRIVVVMHDINTAAAFADTIIAMQDGRIHSRGPVDEVISAENLADLYETPVRVEQLGERRVVIWD